MMKKINHSKRLGLRQLARLGLLTGSSLTFWIQDVLALGSLKTPSGLYQIEGEVYVNGQVASAGMPIGAGDVVQTGPNALAVYVMAQDAFLQRDNSTVQIGLDASKIFLQVVSGKLLSVFGKGDKTLRTPAANLGIRGTACYIEATAEQVYFCLCYGRAEVSPLANPSQITTIETSHHDHPVMITQHSDVLAMADAQVINHTDAELIMLEALVWRRPPFLDAPGGTPRY